jgi:hypothetical protein
VKEIAFMEKGSRLSMPWELEIERRLNSPTSITKPPAPTIKYLDASCPNSWLNKFTPLY